MAPSEKTVLRRVQRAGQRQRMCEALAKATESEAVAQTEQLTTAAAAATRPQVRRPPEGKASSQGGREECAPTSQEVAQEDQMPPLHEEEGRQHVRIRSFVDSLLTTTNSSQKLTAEEFVNQVCRLVDEYRAGLKESASTEVEPVPSRDLASDALSCTTELTCTTQSDACQLDVRKCEQEAVAHDVCCEPRPVPSKPCAYTVRNTFIDLLPAASDIKDSQTAFFSTWPEHTPSAADERLHSDPTLSHRTGAPVSQLEAGEIVDDLEEGELLDDEVSLCEFSNLEICAFTTGNWESNQQVPEKCIAPCKVIASDELAKAGLADCLKAETAGLNVFLRQSLDGYKGSLGACSQEPNSPCGRWCKTNGEAINGSLTSPGDSRTDHCTGNASSPCVLSLESALLGEQQQQLQPNWFNVQPQIPWMPQA